jgi:hypothetical protein
MMGVEDNVRKVLASKQKEHDRLSFLLKKRQAELERLKLQLRDVKVDSQALGLGVYPESERLQTVKVVSTRPVFAKNTVRARRCDSCGYYRCVRARGRWRGVRGGRFIVSAAFVR